MINLFDWDQNPDYSSFILTSPSRNAKVFSQPTCISEVIESQL